MGFESAIGPIEAGDAVAFSPANGVDQLGLSFADVDLLRFQERLEVTVAEPLLAYILSSAQIQQRLASLEAADREHRATTLRELIAEQLAVKGQIRITKDAGLFIARCP